MAYQEIFWVIERLCSSISDFVLSVIFIFCTEDFQQPEFFLEFERVSSCFSRICSISFSSMSSKPWIKKWNRINFMRILLNRSFISFSLFFLPWHTDLRPFLSMGEVLVWSEFLLWCSDFEKIPIGVFLRWTFSF